MSGQGEIRKRKISSPKTNDGAIQGSPVKPRAEMEDEKKMFSDEVILIGLAMCFVLLFLAVMGKVLYQMNQARKSGHLEW